MARNAILRQDTYWRITVSTYRTHAGTDFRPGVVFTVREDVLPGISDIILTKEKVG